jgi:predicted Zn finger-like uncharacterized protein
MIVECNNCHAKYNVDESKVPVNGIKVKCHKCQSIIFIQREKPVPEPVTQPVPPPEIPDEGVKQEPQDKESVAEPSGIPEPVKPDIPESPPAAVESTVAPSAPETEISVTPPQAAGEMSEEDQKWHKRARRLAKALASDLVLYNQDKVEEGLRDGTLAQLLGSEIRRSWEYYCQQIPKHIVDSTDYFKQQLNKIVGKGKEIFK